MATFRVPPTLATDFDKFLQVNLLNQVENVELIHDWINRENTTSTIRAEIYPASTKSRYENMDNVMNIRVSLNSGIKKGDYIIRKNGIMYLVDWEIEPETNNIPSRITRCNSYVTYKRYQQEIVDSMGYLITKEGYINIATNIPTNVYKNDGRPDYTVVSTSPGVSPNALTVFSMQWNSETKKLQENDEMVYLKDTYIIVDIDYVGVNLEQTSGVLKLYAKKKPGGVIND